MLSLKNVSKAYRGHAAIADLSLDLPRGEIVGLFGENGAGKTTLMKCMLGFIHHYGQITLDGEPITRRNIAKFSFATAEHSFFPGLTAEGHRDFYAAHFPTFSSKRYNGLMDFFDLPRCRAIRTFSLGQQNQFEVILALSQGADYILMDEPFSGNDLFNRADFYRLLSGLLSERETLLLSTHLIEEVDGFVGRAILLKDGNILADVTSDTLDDRGQSLTEYVKEAYHYRPDRVARALGAMCEPDEESTEADTKEGHS